jgi:hypothetical protein
VFLGCLTQQLGTQQRGNGLLLSYLPEAAPEPKSGMFECRTTVAEVEDQRRGIQAAISWLRQFYGIFLRSCFSFLRVREIVALLDSFYLLSMVNRSI